MKVGLLLEGGGILGARTDGIVAALLPHVEVEYVVGTSAGAKTGLCLLWAQARTLEATGSLQGEGNRQTVARFFQKANDTLWKNACFAATCAQGVETMQAMLPPWLRPTEADRLSVWQHESFVSDSFGHITHPLANLIGGSLPGIDRDLRNPHVTALTTNCVHAEDGIEVLTRTRGLDGAPQESRLLMHVASGVVPPYFPAIDGHIDGAFARNGPVAGAVPETSETPLIRVALGKPDFTSRFKSHRHLRQRAQEAFDFIGEPLPTDRPTFEFASPADLCDRAHTPLPERGDIARRFAAGLSEAQAALGDGLLERLRRPTVWREGVPRLQLAA